MTKKYPGHDETSSHSPIRNLASQLLSGVDENTGLTVQRGTATRTGGRQTARKILGAALQLLLSEESHVFSLRAIASKADVRLANVQYYYPNKDALLQALCDVIYESYERGYDLTVQQGDLPEHALERVIRYQIDDAQQQETRRFFIRLWLLLEDSKAFDGSLLAKLYEPDIRSLTALVQSANQLLNETEANARAKVMAAMIEGSMVVSSAPKLNDALKQVLVESCLKIALAPPS